MCILYCLRLNEYDIYLWMMSLKASVFLLSWNGLPHFWGLYVCAFTLRSL